MADDLLYLHSFGRYGFPSWEKIADAAVFLYSHGHFLQCVVSTVRTKLFHHVFCYSVKLEYLYFISIPWIQSISRASLIISGIGRSSFRDLLFKRLSHNLNTELCNGLGYHKISRDTMHNNIGMQYDGVSQYNCCLEINKFPSLSSLFKQMNIIITDG
jgi:hypothetical protein